MASEDPSGDAKTVDESRDPKPVEAELIDLADGNELSEQQALAIEIAVPTRLIVVAGPAECGKTTLLISLYELFQWGQVSGYVFTGSQTLPGFERRCHNSRIASDRATADTLRTRYEDNEAHYLHLRVSQAEALTNRIDFLFTDLSGESFERARDSIEECQQLSFLLRTEHFMILLDGEKFAQAGKRWAIIQEAELLLRSCLDSNMLGKNTFVEVVLAKYDYLEIAPDRAELDEIYKRVEEDFRSRFEERVGRLIFEQIAARPLPNSQLPFGYGVISMLNRWAGSSPRQRRMQILPSSSRGKRESDSFFDRHFGSQP